MVGHKRRRRLELLGESACIFLSSGRVSVHEAWERLNHFLRPVGTSFGLQNPRQNRPSLSNQISWGAKSEGTT